VFTARYAQSPYIKYTNFAFKRLMRCNTLQNTIEIMYLVRSGPEVYVCFSVNLYL
jgi:hypothetical protein